MSNFLQGALRSVLEVAYPNLNEAEAALAANETLMLQIERLQEDLADVELAYDALGWKDMGTLSDNWQFNRDKLKKIMDLSRKMYIMNPLVRRAVEVQTLYVFAQGFSLKAEHPDIQEVVDDFFYHPKNMRALTSMKAWSERNDDQQILGNNFIILVHDEDKGTLRGRIVPVDQIADIICDPQDYGSVWFYKRTWTDKNNQTITKLYPDVGYTPETQEARAKDSMGEYDIEWGSPIYHIRTGGLSNMKFGCPEYMSVFTWALAYKTMLENFASILQAYARMAMKITNLPGKAGVAAAKSKINTGAGKNNVVDTNPSTNAASWFLASGKTDISAVKTAGATTSAEEGRPLRLMVASGTGYPDTFFGDSDVGNFATSTTLDRPTELKMVNRQKLWIEVILLIIDQLILWSAKAPEGKLKEKGFDVEEGVDEFDGTITYKIIAPKNTDKTGGKVGEPISTVVAVAFPNILERNVTERVRAVVAAATLNGSPADGIIPDRRLVCELLLEALGLDDVPQAMKALYPNGSVTQGYVTPVDRLKVDQKEADAKAKLAQAAQDGADASLITAKKPTPKPAPAARPASTGAAPKAAGKTK